MSPEKEDTPGAGAGKGGFAPKCDLYSPEYMAKYRKYEAQHARMIIASYFSHKNFYGGRIGADAHTCCTCADSSVNCKECAYFDDDVFNEKTAIGGAVIQSSRWPCTRSFADPVLGFEDQSSSSSTSVDEVPNDLSNGKPPVKNS